MTSFTTNVTPSAGFGSFDTATTAHTFGPSTAANAFPQPVNFFSTPVSTLGQPSVMLQQGSAASGFAGSASFTASSLPQTTFGFAQPAAAESVQSQTGDTAASLVYTPLDQLSAEDRAQFEAPKFTLGHVPVRPPPKELI